ncbi:MAG: 3-phosphoshikimate 1-carboxyvinyltransferase [Salegentibacter sp.]|uniref:3-phosphoshikimate 1-carboxyvinyltransferase n=1 Tax=Salegentibacter flavus TaxID=287099 RepID=A0A1I4YVW0_9FLAO|nr:MULTISPECIES: 3-phosphoshikimate 1-carboxyvinyltransferase [Salegentibacter]MDR9457966.1 3-phosphoshikimate 1-carboxyvinyltransferase [Salegentibacter sp.]SFN42155.1 3-phosphoshikimate 1-carboxyvinyltransferase [Salegentibacter flavus]
MKIKLFNDKKQLSGDLKITGSKSESNRLLILQALYPSLKVENLSNSDDTQYLKKALASEEELIDIHHAGTAMRFLTAYFATREGREVVLTGSPRMQERPVKLLVDALKTLGADISYEKEEGYPPLRIKGKTLTENEVKVQANISSQYISALMLIAPSLLNGLQIDLVGQVTSAPYINMTLEMMKNAGVTGEFTKNKIIIGPAEKLESKTIAVESDWSSASYFYSLAAISETAHLRLGIYREKSLQGDCCISEIYRQFGVETHYEDDAIVLKKTSQKKPRHLAENLIDSPDIAQTIAVTCLALGVNCTLKGLHTLKIKETDRLAALKTEIEKFGSSVKISKDSLELIPQKDFTKNVSVATYNDHRMAMAFAPLGLKVPFEIEDAMVVSKSYPDFWKDLEKLGFNIGRA